MIDRATFDANGLLPAIIQQWDSKDVLMLGYMDAEALRRTLTEGRVTFWSRSRQEYWRKGDTSGNRQYVRGAALDCDADTILVTAVAEAVEQRLPKQVLLLPTLWFGASHHHLPFGGTLSASVDLHIDTLVLHGVAHADAPTLASALSEELSRLAREPAAFTSVRAESVQAAPYADGAPDAAGRAAAAALWAALPARGQQR